MTPFILISGCGTPLRIMSDFRWNIRRNPAKVGTPENPEIIEPDGTRPQREAERAAVPGRLRRTLQIFTWMLYVSAPALFVDSVWFWLFEMGRGDGGAIAWLLLLLISLPALAMTLLAAVVNSFLMLMLVSTVLGKPVSEHPVPFVRFIRFGK